MRPSHLNDPLILIQESGDGHVSIRIEHYGRVPDLAAEFSPEVLQQAVNKFRSSREHRILEAARKLTPVARRVVEAHLIRERALAIEVQREAKTRRASWTQRRAEEPQDQERDARVEERAESQRQRGSPERAPTPTKDEAERAKEQSWLDALLEPLERPDARPETLTERAQRELAEAKANRPKVSRSEQRAMDRALAEREESLRDLVEFTPQPEKQPSLTEKARQESGAARAEPKGRSERAKDRTR